MKFLLDQSTDARLLTYLTQRGHDATQIRRTSPENTIQAVAEIGLRVTWYPSRSKRRVSRRSTARRSRSSK
jgi:hypothetical protein